MVSDIQAIIRRARPSDAEGIARVHIASSEESLAPLARDWPASDLGRRTEQWAASLQAANRLDLVATIADDVVGFIGGGPPRKQDLPGAIEIYVVHVLPAHRGAGIGGQLWDLACTSLRGPAHAPLYLETLAELPCCTFYDARGGEVLTRTAGTFFGGAVTHLTYYWPAGKPHQRETTDPSQPPALKDGESSHPIPGAWRPTLKKIVDALVAGDYALKTGIAGVRPVKKKTATHIERYISDYGCTLIELPDETWRTSITQWYEGHWEFLVDLWTSEEGRSDLVLSGHVTEAPTGYVFDVHLVYVP